ncbi:MAG TPA: O-antigen ligase family protein [Solirubrobacterales bacterium]
MSGAHGQRVERAGATKAGADGNSDRSRAGALAGRELERVLFALVLGIGVPLSGFPPFNHLADVVDVEAHPFLVPLVPSVVLALVAGVAAWRLPRPAGRDGLLLSATMALLVAGCLSLIGSDDPQHSALLLLTTLVAPLGFLWALRRADVPYAWLCGAFLATVCLLLLRADVVFLSDHGFPTGSALFQAKFSNQPYDFHYYALNNPDQAATFLIFPLALAAFWAIGERLERRFADALALAAAFLLINLGLVFVRAGAAFGVLVVVAAILASPMRRRRRLISAAAVILAVVAVVVTPSVWSYISKATDTATSDASAVTRADSIADGTKTMLDHPLTGVGLGEYGTTRDRPPAHSTTVQAGAEMGVLGALGALAILTWLVRTAWRGLRRNRLRGLAGGAAVAALAYWVNATLFGGANIGFGNGFVAIWGMSLAIGVATASRAADAAPVPLAQLRAQLESPLAFVRRAAQAPRARALALAAWGMSVAFWSLGQVVDKPIAMLGTRADDVDLALRGLRAGAPPFLGLTAGGAYLPFDAGRRGLSLFLAVIQQWFFQATPQDALHLAALLAFAVSFVVWPLVFAALFDSFVVGLLAPLGLYVLFAPLGTPDIYWIPGWFAVTALPLVLLLWQRWDALGSRRAMVLLSLVVVWGSFVNSLRFSTALPVLLAALVVVFASVPRWRWRIGGALILVLAYFSVNSALLGAVSADRDHVVKQTAKYRDNLLPTPGNHANWHLAYIGLSFSEFPHHGISRWDDSEAFNYVKRVRPGTPYLSGTYDRVLRDRVLDIAREDPGFVAGALSGKAFAAIGDGLKHSLLLLCLIPAAVILGHRRRLLLRLLILSLPALLVWFSSPVIVVPVSQYTLAFVTILRFFGVVALLVLADSMIAWWSPEAARSWWRKLPQSPLYRALLAGLGILALVAVDRFFSGQVPGQEPILLAAAVLLGAFTVRVMAERPSGVRKLLGQARDWRVAAAAAAVAVLLVGNALVLASRPQRDLMVWLAANPDPAAADAVPSSTAPVRDWAFDGGLPRGWTPVVPLQITPHRGGSGLDVTTSAATTSYQLQSPIVTLPPGRYYATFKGEVNDGAVQLGALNVSTQTWAGTKAFWTRQTRDRPSTLAVPFTLPSTTPVQLILSNTRADPVSSRWHLEEVELREARPSRDAPKAQHQNQAQKGS